MGFEHTEEKIDGLQAGRELDVLIETKIMGRKVKFDKRVEACAWDGQGNPIMKAADDYILDDYDPKIDGPFTKPSYVDPRAVFKYSDYDGGMVRVMDRLKTSPGLQEMGLAFRAKEGWAFTLTWDDPMAKGIRTVIGRDLELARLAVYRGALKAILT